MKYIFLLSLFAFSSLLSAQDISTHIPKHSTYIVTINPATHVFNGDMKQVNTLEMFTQSNEYGSKFDYLYGDEDLDWERKNAFAQLFKDIFSNPTITGVDTARKIFIFNDTPDSIHYWAYLLPINNGATFGDYISTHLFSEKKEIKKGSGFSEINAEKISVGWTNSYAIFLFADFDYSHKSTDMYSQLFAADSAAQAQMYQDQMAKAIADSTAMANEMKAQNDSIIPDSVRQNRMNSLMKEQSEMISKLAKDTIPEENYMPDYNSEQSYDYGIDNSQHIIDSTMTAKAMRKLNYLINLSYEESVQDIPNFRNVSEEKSDAVYWFNYGEMMQQYYEKNMLERNSYAYLGMGADTANIQNMWLGSYIVSLVHFEGNVAKMEQRSYFSPALQEHTTGLYAGRVDKKMFKYVKGENLMAFVSMSVNMEKMMKFYGSVYRESLNNSLAGMYGNYYMMMWDMLRVFIDDKTLYNLLDGQFLFAVTDLKPYTASYVTYDFDENFNKTEIRKEKTEIRPEFIMVAGIGQKEDAEKILEILQRANAIKKQNNQYYLINTPGEYDIKMFLAIQNGMLIVTNNEELMLNNLKHGYSRGKAMNGKLKKLGRKSALVAYWDGKKSFELVKKNQQVELSEADKKSLELLQQDVNSGLILGRKGKNGIQRIDMKIELNDPQPGSKQTSFVRFFRLLNSLYLVHSNH
ncbi:MAG: hypothetical protein NT084_07305 [Bacteroidetes bacterium]|nr:hypothetical protein [Bacteroidota bacterium]